MIEGTVNLDQSREGERASESAIPSASKDVGSEREWYNGTAPFIGLQAR